MPHPVLVNGGTSAEWALENPILPANTTGTETDTSRTKIGNGSSYWNSLKYTDEPSGADILALAVSKAIKESDKDVNIVDELLLNWTEQIIVPSLAAANAATYSQSGNIITVDNGIAHNIPATTYDGSTVYLAIGTVSTGVAPTSGFLNFFTNFQRTGANTFTCRATNSQIGTGVVNTNTSITALTQLTKTVPASSLTVGDRVSVNACFSNNNSAGAKTFQVNLVGAIASVSVTTATGTIVALGNAMHITSSTRFFRGGNPSSPATINLAIDNTLLTTLLCAAANDFICLEGIVISKILGG